MECVLLFDVFKGCSLVVICKPRHCNLDIGIDIINAIISSSIEPVDLKLSKVVN